MNVHRFITILLSSYIFASCKVHPNPYWAAEMDDTRVNGISWFEHILWFCLLHYCGVTLWHLEENVTTAKVTKVPLIKGIIVESLGIHSLYDCVDILIHFPAFVIVAHFPKLIGMINIHYLCAKNKHCKKIMFYIFKYSNKSNISI